MSGINRKPTMYVLAGNNGCGKSTLRHNIIDYFSTAVNIDPDMLARKFKDIDKNPLSKGGREAIRLAKQCIEGKIDFSIETTLAGNLILRQIQEAKENGFHIEMFYVGTDAIEINLNRIEQRVRNGGHHIPEETVRKRSDKTITNLVNNLDLIDTLRVIDTTEDVAKTILIKREENLHYTGEPILNWILPIKEALDSK